MKSEEARVGRRVRVKGDHEWTAIGINRFSATVTTWIW